MNPRGSGGMDAEGARQIAAEVERRGFAVIRGGFSESVCEHACDVITAAVTRGDLIEPAVRRRQTELDAAPSPALRKIAREGEDALARTLGLVYVRNVLMCEPVISEVLLCSTFIDVADSYYGRPTTFVGPRGVRSYVNDLPPSSVNRFHIDYQENKFLKFIVYLTDVEQVADGPFVYVEGSLHQRPDDWLAHGASWDESEIVSRYGSESIRPVLGTAGDVVVADTRGLHRGARPLRRPRSVLKVSTTVEPWAGPSQPIPTRVYRRLDPRQQRACASLVPVADAGPQNDG